MEAMTPAAAGVGIRLEKLEMTGSEKPFTATSKKELLEAFDKYAA